MKPFVSAMLLAFVVEMAVGESLASRLKRSVQAENASMSCSSAFQNCGRNKHCRAALAKLNTRCKVTAGRCSAEMKDVPRCGLIMDHLFRYGLPEQRCDCSEKDKACVDKRKRLYDNPCFSAIRLLREQGLFPKEIDAYDKVVKYQETTIASLAYKLTTEAQQPATHVKSESDGGKAQTTVPVIPAVQATSNPSIIGNDLSGNSDAQLSSNSDGDAKREKINNKAHSGIKPDESPQTIVHRQGQIDRYETNPDKGLTRITNSDSAYQVNAEFLRTKFSDEIVPRQESIKEDYITDYKSIAIILGILLTIVVLSSLVVFLWTRGNAKFYEGAQCMKGRRMDDGSFSTVKFLPPETRCEMGH